jgi:uncharacterized protein (DUF2236 family)
MRRESHNGVMTSPMFGPDSMMRRINSEPVLLLGARAALLMQLAHPLVAAAVAEHSRFRDDPMGRLRATLRTISTIVFGTEQQARAAARRANALHATVGGRNHLGRAYSATDPDLLVWVYGTLVHTAVGVYNQFVCRLAGDDRANFYHESKAIARLFGVPDDHIPSTLDDLQAWMRDRIESDEVDMTPLARELAAPLLRPVPWVPKEVAGRLTFVVASLLPDELRTGYGLSLGRPDRLAVDALSRVSRIVTPRTPPVLKSLVLRPLLPTTR